MENELLRGAVEGYWCRPKLERCAGSRRGARTPSEHAEVPLSKVRKYQMPG